MKAKQKRETYRFRKHFSYKNEIDFNYHFLLLINNN